MKDMKTLLGVLIAGTLCAAVVACGSRGDQAWLEDSGLSPFAVRIQGNWWAECALSPDVGLTRISALFMNRELFRRTTQVSWSTECNTWDEEIVENYEFFVNGDVGNNERELELHLKNITAKPLTRTGAAQLNQASWCGISDWSEGVARDVTAAAGNDSCMPNRQQEIRTVITLQGDTLMIGQMDNIATARTLDKNQVYRRPPPPTPTPVPQTNAPLPTPPPPATATPDSGHNPPPDPGDQPPPDDTVPHVH